MTHPLLSPSSLPLAATAPLKLLRHGHCCLHDKQPALFITAPHSPGLPSELRDTATRLAAGTKDLHLSYLTTICWEFLSPLSLVTCRLCSSVRHFWLLSLPLPPNFSASTESQPQSVLPRAARRASQIKCTSRACSTSARALPSNRSLLWPASHEALGEMPSSFCALIACAFPHSLL